MSIVPANYLERIDPALSLLRIQHDTSTDLIYAPHLSAVYAHLGEELFEHLIADVKADRFLPALPITMEIPKKNGLTRPGSILEPLSRLTYQLLVDDIAPYGEEQVDRNRVFSHQLLNPDPSGEMFKKSNECYADFTSRIGINSMLYDYILQADISCYFERVYQHNLINFLVSSGAPDVPVRALEKLIGSFTERDSHGIIQGLAPSDFLGNIYLCPLDAEIAMREIPSARYVDDIYLFFASENLAKRTLVDLCKHLRREGLNLNENKTKIAKATEHAEADAVVLDLFQQARNELAASNFVELETHYGFISEWALPEPDPQIDPDNELNIDLQAVRSLYSERQNRPFYSDSIDKFCLPIFSAVKDDTAVEDVLNDMDDKPHLASIYCNYLSSFAASDTRLVRELTRCLSGNDLIYESQRMWILAALITCQVSDEAAVQECLKLIRAQSAETVRALACIYVGSCGSAAQRRILKQQYSGEQSPYVRGAILYASKYFPKNERDTCCRSWGAHSTTNSLIAKTVKKLALT